MRRATVSLLLATAALLGGHSANAAYVSYTNGILTVEIENAGTSAGMFWVRTGASHPNPDENILYHTESSWITLRDVTAQEIWTNNASTTPDDDIPGYTSLSMQVAPATAVVTNLPTGFRTTYTLPNWVVVQDVTVNGSTLADSNVQQTVTVTNTSSVSRSYGLRYLWDWEVAGNDNSVFRTRSPDSAFTDVFVAFDAPTFQAFQEQDTLVAPTFSVFGTVRGGTLVPVPTTPDRFGYVSWSDANESPWDFAVSGSGDDSATVHYWGYATPLALAAAGSASFTQYISTVQGSIGLTPTNVAVPTVSERALIALSLVLALGGLVALRRRGLAGTGA